MLTHYTNYVCARAQLASLTNAAAIEALKTCPAYQNVIDMPTGAKRQRVDPGARLSGFQYKARPVQDKSGVKKYTVCNDTCSCPRT